MKSDKEFVTNVPEIDTRGSRLSNRRRRRRSAENENRIEYQRTRSYIDIVGIRSFIFQLLLGIWTAFIILSTLMLSAPLKTKTSLEEARDLYNEHVLGIPDITLVSTLVIIPGITWSIIAFPLIIAAVATLKERK